MRAEDEKLGNCDVCDCSMEDKLWRYCLYRGCQVRLCSMECLRIHHEDHL